MSDPTLRALASAALEIGERRAKLLDRMRRALLEGDDAEALRCGRLLTGLEEEDDAKGDRPNAGFH